MIPTRDIAQGIHAAIMVDPEFDAEVNAETMIDSIGDVKCGEVTQAVRETALDGFDIKIGDIIGLDGKKIVAKAENVVDATKDLIEALIDKNTEVITLYYGENVTEDEANALVEELQEKYEDFEIFAYYGGQPHYYYLLSIE